MGNNIITQTETGSIQRVPAPGRQEVRKFAAQIREKLLKQYGDGWEIQINDVLKNNSLYLTGLHISRKDSAVTNIVPVIYMDGYYQQSQEGRDEGSICREIMGVWEQNREPGNLDMSCIGDFAKARTKICYRLINAEANRELLETLPHRHYLDMAIIYYMGVAKGNKMDATVTVTLEIMKAWKTDEETLYCLASENTSRNLGHKITSMTDKIRELTGLPMDGETEPSGRMLDGAPEMYVASNSAGVFGACVMLHDRLLRRFADVTGDDFYILPSSVHEVLFLPVRGSGGDAESLGQMVREVNAGVLEPGDVLSDHVYYYSAEKDRVSIVV